ADAAGPVGPLPVVRERRPDLLRLWLGDAAPRDRLPGGLPGAPRPALALPPEHAAVTRGDRPAALADLPPDVRSGADQAAGRPLLAGPHLPLLPLRDPAQPEPALLVPAPAPALVPSPGGALQPRGRAGGAVLRLRPP